jgi:hypothetical protein
MTRAPRYVLAAAIAFAAGPRRADAGPTVIRDEMLRDTAFTPVLGRGYSIATNTFQSTCLVDVVRTKPSYNFDYRFEEMNDDGTVSSSYSRSVSSARSSGFFTRARTERTTRYDAKTKETWHRHRMLVTILVDVYYSSIDEAQSKMSPAASALLTAQDLPGFFDACGMYYVRSISRQAAFISMFTYESTSTDRDTTFEASLRTAIKGFFGGNLGNSSDTTSSSLSSSQTVTNLTIESHGLGLGKSQSADIIAYDVATYRNAVKNAFQSTQPDEVGLVTAIEVAPWVENTEFQALNKLVPVTVPVTDSDGQPVMEVTPDGPKPKTKTVLPYAQKRTLSQNAEFLAEIDRAARAKLNVFYKARACRAQINLDYMTQNPDDGTWTFTPRDAANPAAGDSSSLPIVNNRATQEWSTLGELYTELSDDKLQRLWMEYDAFMYGGTGKDLEGIEKDPKQRAAVARAILLGTKTDVGYPANVFPGAEKCVADLIEHGITVKSHRDVKACQRVEESFGTVAGKRVDDYCPASFSEPPAKAGGPLNP